MRRSARKVAILLDYDLPEIIHLKSGKTNLLALCLVGIDEAPDYLAVTVNAGDWEKFINDRCDVRYLFTTPVTRIVYFFSINNLSDSNVQMQRMDDVIPDNWLPSGQLFASELENIDAPVEFGIATRTLFIDGEWDSAEFGHLQRKMSDVYTFVSIVDGADDPLSNKKARRSFYDKPLAGGSSYGSLFSDLLAATPIQKRLKLEKIKKESPGYISMRAAPDQFDAVTDIIAHHMRSRTATRDLYLALRLLLSSRKLLRCAILRYDPLEHPDTAIISQTIALYQAIGIERTDRILSLTENNTLAFAKVALALYRRIDEAMLYFAEGRARFRE